MAENTALQKYQAIEGQFERRAEEIKQILPSHIPPARFTRVALTAVQQNRDLLDVPPGALFRACIQCAQDGLLPDGREAVLVTFTFKQGPKAGQTIVSYQPMIAGIRKKVRNSGEIASWEADLVYENDLFELRRGTDPRIIHEPTLSNRGRLIAVYSVAFFKTGEKSSDWMTLEEVASIRARSRSANKGPWVTDFGEMVKKTMLKRHAKSLPLSAELDSLMRREDEMYDLTPQSSVEQQVALPDKRRGRLKLSDPRLSTSLPEPSPLEPAQEGRAATAAADEQYEAAVSPPPGSPPGPAGGGARYLKDAEKEGYDAYWDGTPCFPLPLAYQGDAKEPFADAYKRGWNAGRSESEDAGVKEGETEQ